MNGRDKASRVIRSLISFLRFDATDVREYEHTSPAQKISLGHHACLGGKGTWEGRAEESGALGLATAVETVTDGAVALLTEP